MVGGLIGSIVVWQLVEPWGTGTLLVVCAAATVLIGALVWRTEAVAARPGAAIGRRPQAGVDDGGGDRKKTNAALEGAKLVFSSRYLLSIVMIMFLYELVSQILDYQYATGAETLEGADATQAFFGMVGTITNVISVVTQFFLVSFVIRHFGITTALLVLPAAAFLSSGVYFAIPVLWTGALLTISDNAFNYSINQTARETLFVPTSADEQYKARAFSNMFVQRMGKGAAILMALVLNVLPIRFLSLIAMVVIAIWISFAVSAGRRFHELTAES